jgi:hypothetical protein
MRKRLLLAAALLSLLAAPSAFASPAVLYGLQDDAWLATGPGTLAGRLAEIDRLGADVVRTSLHWDRIETAQGSFDWQVSDAVLQGLRAHGIAPVVTLVGTPAWANRGRAPNWAPTSPAAFAAFARAAAARYPWVRYWTIWNEPNQVINLRPTSPAVYVSKLLNPGYAAIHAVLPRALVAGGVTAPRSGPSGVGPVAWMRGMRAAGARLDVYAHHPYPGSPFETPFGRGCHGCDALTMANLPRLLGEVQRDFGSKHVWLTEYGYQTNPPDQVLGVSPALQAAYLGQAALRAYTSPRVDMLIQFLYQDEPDAGHWQSGLVTAAGAPKPSLQAFPLPVVEVGRKGTRAVLWGQVRPGSGAQPYRLQQLVGGRWQWLGGTSRTTSRGFFQRTVVARPGTRFRAWSPAAPDAGMPLVLR